VALDGGGRCGARLRGWCWHQALLCCTLPLCARVCVWVSSYTINGADQGVCFTGLSGLELWPAVQFYSSGRVVRFLRLEGVTSAGVCSLILGRHC
jgi:hypothetical protein